MKLGFCSLLALILVIFKLSGGLEISWIWALSPIWIGYTVTMIIVAFVTMCVFAIAYISEKKK